MLLRSKVWDLSIIIFWLLSVGRVVDGSVNDVENSVMKTESTSNSERTTSAQDYDDFDEDDEDEYNLHRDVFESCMLLMNYIIIQLSMQIKNYADF